MSETGSAKRYALLVGIDLYFNNGAREQKRDTKLLSNNLQGCFNDIMGMESLLRKRHQLESIDILASPLQGDTSVKSARFKANPLLWPTYENLKQGFENIYQKIKPGDLFFFHFSGYGATLTPIDGSPTYHKKDPALLPVDFFNGQPAVRGWELNEWLKRFTVMNVHVTVSLDSCYSSESWGVDGEMCRTSKGWSQPIPNLPLDQSILHQLIWGSRSHTQSAGLGKAWDLDPEAFTLMTACQADERAMEKNINGVVHGAFTHELLRYLEQDDLFVTKASMQREMQRRLEGLQKPEIYGQDKQLLFFRSGFELCHTSPILCRIDANMIIIPVGKAHGICPFTEFTPYPRTSDIVFSVSHVDNFECRAAIPGQFHCPDPDMGCMVIPWRWSLGEEALRVVVDDSLWRSPLKSLHHALVNWVSDPIDIIRRHINEVYTDILSLEMFAGHVHIRGPPSLVGYAVPIRHIKIGIDDARVATKAALCVAHLARFKQLLDLQQIRPSEPQPFSVTTGSLTQVDAPSKTGSHELKIQFTLTLSNDSEHELYFTIVVFGSEFNVEQIYPSNSTPTCVPPYSQKVLRVSMKLSDPSPGVRNVLKNHDRRSIIRTLVAKGNHISWKAVELPHIWDAGQANFNRRLSQWNYAETDDASDEWWIYDQNVTTSAFRSFPNSDNQHNWSRDMLNRILPMKEKVVSDLETPADILEAASAPINTAEESQAFRDILETISEHIDEMSPYAKLSAIEWDVSEYDDPEEKVSLDTYDMSFAVRWELPEFIRSELEGNWDIGSVLTINGTMHEPYAETCKEYIELFWPTAWYDALESMLSDLRKLFKNESAEEVEDGTIERAASLKTGSSASDSKTGPIQKVTTGIALSDNLKLSRIDPDNENIRFEVSGKRHDLIYFAQLLAWLTAVFRMPKYGTISKSSVKIKRTAAAELAGEMFRFGSSLHSHEKLSFNIDLIALQDINLVKEHFCWRPLLNNTVIAEGFPIRKRTGGVGLELPFHAMLTLSCASHSLQNSEWLMFKSFSSAVVLQNQIDSESVQWHYIQSSDPQERLSINDARPYFTKNVQDLDIDTLSATRSFLGYNSDVYVIVGTEQSGYTSADISRAERPPERMMIGTTLTPALGSRSGPLSLEAKITFSRGLRVPVLQDQINTEQRLLNSKDRPLLMYDVQNKTAFLIPEICAILELAHVWASKQKDSEKILEKIPFSDPRWDGGEASYTVILKAKELILRDAYAEEKAVWFMSLLRDFFMAFEMRRDVRRDNNEEYLQWPKISPAIRGWELSEIAAFDGSEEKRVDLGDSLDILDTSGRWDAIPAENPDMIVLFYEGLAQPISAKNKQEACWAWTPLPKGYLLATVQCMRQLSKSFGGSDDKPKLTNKLFWDTPDNGKIFELCSEGQSTGCPRAQVLVKEIPKTSFPDKPHGAIIFGKSRRTGVGPCVDKLRSRPMDTAAGAADRRLRGNSLCGARPNGQIMGPKNLPMKRSRKSIGLKRMKDYRSKFVKWLKRNKT